MRSITGLLCIILTFCIVASAFGAVYVKQDSPGPVYDGLSWETAFHTVQEGVNAAASGSSVWVAAGNYPESVNLKTGVSLLGGYYGSGSARDIKANVSKIISCAMTGPCTLEGFTIDGATENAVSCTGSGACVIRLNTITGTQTYGVYAMTLATVENNTISNSSAAALDYGIYCMATGTNRVGANRVSGQNTGISSAGGYVYNNVVSNACTGILIAGSSLYVMNNLVCDNYLAGIAITGIGQVHANIILRNGYGIENRTTTSTAAYFNDVCGNRTDYSTYVTHNSTNISADPIFENPEAGDYRLAFGSPCIDKGSTILSGKSITTDINGLPRVYGTYADIGPSEFQPAERISVSPSNNLVCLMEPGATASLSQIYTIYNIGTQSMSWNAAKTADWVNLSASSGVIESGQSATVSVSINSAASSLSAGRYSDVITFTSSATSEILTRNVNLILGSVVYVDSQANGSIHDGTTWQKAYLTISEAIDAALPGQEIRVAKGTYPEYILIRKNITLKGGYLGQGDARDIAANETIIEKPDDYGDTVIFESPCTIDGFTITKGYDGVWGMYDSTISLTNCTFRGNSHSGVTLQYANGTVSRCKATENRYGIVLYSNLCKAVNNLVYRNTSYGMNMQTTAVGVNNTCVSNGENGIIFGVSSPNSINNLLFGNYTNYANVTGTKPADTGPDPLFINSAANNYRLGLGSPYIDAGTSTGSPTIDMDGYSRPMDGDGDGAAKVDVGCYEAPSSFASPAKIKALPDGSPVRLSNIVTTAALPDRFYVESPNRISGIGVLGNVASTGRYVSVDGILCTIDGERMIDPNGIVYVLPASAPIPAPWYVNFNALGGGAIGLQAGVQDLRMAEKFNEPTKLYMATELSSYGGANNIGLLVKMTGRVLNATSNSFYLDGASSFDLGNPGTRGVRVDWPFSALPPANGSFVSILGISSCYIVHNEANGDIVLRLLRPVSAESVVTFAIAN